MSKLSKVSFILFVLSFSLVLAQKNFAQYVNPFIGTGGHGHTFPGATVPFGMVQLSPDTRIDGSWDGCSGYHYSDAVIYGFSHTHLNGTGVSDYGDILLMPTMGTPSLDNKDYSSTFSHQNEKASAGYYEVLLDKFNIKARLTTTTRVGYHEYTFNNSGLANIILDLNHRDELLEGEVKVIDEKTIEVYRRSKAWAENQYIFAKIEFSKPMKVSKTRKAGKSTDGYGAVFGGKDIALAFSNQVKKGEKILVKVSLSLTGFEGAEKICKPKENLGILKKSRKTQNILGIKNFQKLKSLLLIKTNFRFFTPHCITFLPNRILQMMLTENTEAETTKFTLRITIIIRFFRFGILSERIIL